MSAPIKTTTAWQWPSDVLAFADEENVQGYLDPLLEATRQVFPTARSVKVTVEDDPEIRDDRHIVFDLYVPHEDVPDFVEALHEWNQELGRLVPAPLACVFRLSLELVAA